MVIFELYMFWSDKIYCRGGSRLNHPYKQVFVGAVQSRTASTVCFPAKKIKFSIQNHFAERPTTNVSNRVRVAERPATNVSEESEIIPPNARDQRSEPHSLKSII